MSKSKSGSALPLTANPGERLVCSPDQHITLPLTLSLLGQKFIPRLAVDQIVRLATSGSATLLLLFQSLMVFRQPVSRTARLQSQDGCGRSHRGDNTCPMHLEVSIYSNNYGNLEDDGRQDETKSLAAPVYRLVFKGKPKRCMASIHSDAI